MKTFQYTGKHSLQWSCFLVGKETGRKPGGRSSNPGRVAGVAVSADSPGPNSSLATWLRELSAAVALAVKREV